MRQLELFEKMGSKFDTSNELWRKYKLNIMADRMQAGKEMSFNLLINFANSLKQDQVQQNMGPGLDHS